MQAPTLHPTLATRFSHWLDGVIERPLPLLIALFLIFCLVFGASIFLLPKRYGRLVVGDGIYYYVYLRSAVLDRDLDFKNDYEIYQAFNNDDPIKKREMLERKTPLGMAANYFSVGPALLWSPVFVVTHIIATLVGQFGDGYAYLYEAPILFASIAYGFLGILLLYRVLAGMFSRLAAFISILGIWLATNLVYYMGVSPSASHVLSFFTCALFVWLWWRNTPYAGTAGPTSTHLAAPPTRSTLNWFVWGLSAGLMALVRWQDLLIAILALFEWIALLIDQRDPRPIAARLPSALLHGVVFVLGALLAFIPQMLAWQILYGSPLTAPQGAGFFQFLHPEILNVWFSTKRGLFSWTPLLLLALIGFVPLYLKHRLIGTAVVVIFLSETYLNSIVNDWWGGEAFGARRFISLLPFFALGLAAFVDWIRPRVPQTLLLVVLAGFILWNNLFLLQYNLWLHGIGHISALPTLQEMTIDKFTAPFKALDRLRNR